MVALPDNFPAQRDWVKPYLLEKQRGFAILQCQDRLVNQQQENPHGTERKQGEYSGNQPPKYDSVTPATMEQELAELHGEYVKHLRNLSLLDDVKPVNFPPVREQNTLRNYRARYGRPQVWMMDQNKCASQGGCCGRGCGCCGGGINSVYQA